VRATATTAAIEASARRDLVVAPGHAGAVVARGMARQAVVGSSGTQNVAALRSQGRAVLVSPKGSLHVATLEVRGRAVSVVSAVHFQVAAPMVDISDGGWTNELNNNTDLYASIDEVTINGADYVKSSFSPAVVDEMRVRLAPLEYPATTSDHHLRLQFLKDQTGSDRIDLVVRLYAADGTTLIVERTYPDIDALTYVDVELSSGEASAIPTSDYGAGLILCLRALKV
jgi:hypothetical protein